MVTFDGNEIEAITFDGNDIQEVTFDGTVVWTAETIYDSFEAGDLSAYSGSTGDYQVTTTQAHDGTYALETTSTSLTWIFNDNVAGPERGTSFAYAIYPTSSSTIDGRCRVAFGSGTGSDSDAYAARWNNAGSQLSILKDGSILNSSGYNDSNDRHNIDEQWNLVVVDYGETTSSDITMTYYDGMSTSTEVGSVTATDSEYDAGDFGFGMYHNTGFYVDYLHQW